MGWKCVPQVMGLVRGASTEHRANGGQIAREMGHERYSKSVTLDRSRSHLNGYDGYGGSGAAAWDAMCEDAGAYRVQVKTKNGVKERTLREDAVIGCAVAVLPPVDMMLDWTAEDCDRFFDDAQDCLHEIEPRIFRPANRRLKARHRDEGYTDAHGSYGEHEHGLYDCIDEQGKYCGNLVDRKLKEAINKRFPALMRDRGWEIDDCDITDRARMGYLEDDDGNRILNAEGKPIPKDPAYRKERQEKRKRQGRSVNEYRADRIEVANQEAAQLYERARLTDRDARRERHQVRAKANEYARATMEQADEYARATRHQADQDAREKTAQAEQEAEAAKKAADEYAASKRAEADAWAKSLTESVTARLKEKVDEAKEERDAAVKGRKAAVAALQGDYEAWAKLAPKPGANALLGVLGAAVEAARKPPASPGIASATERLRQYMVAHYGPGDGDGGGGPTGPTGP